ncbi:MAG: hypothetical protein DRP13_04580 [Candidatus Aenigmatarchaeota archaeon]|nr:MAG: hypothetical protein DRP13_04580 [Candidatus Aenigmarchaeota archaeon]
MTIKNKHLIYLLSFLLYILLLSFVSADIGPKPSIDIHVTLNGKDVYNFSAVMLTCSKKIYLPENLIPEFNITEYDPINNCYWTPIVSSSPGWGPKCQDSICHFWYFIPKKFRVALYLPEENKTYISSIIENINFRSVFEVKLSDNGGISVEEVTPFFMTYLGNNFIKFIIALFLTLILELSIVFWFFHKKFPRKLLYTIIIVNIISVGIIWLIPFLKLSSFSLPLIFPFSSIIISSEIFVIILEWFFIYFFNKDIISIRKSLLLSVVMNLVSFLIGGWIYSSVAFYI